MKRLGSSTCVLATVLLAMILAISAGAAPGVHASVADQQSEPPKLALSFEYFRGNAPTNSGLILAAWTDGLVVFALDFNNPGQDLRVGHLSSAEVSNT